MQASLRAAISRASSINIGEPHEVLEDIETAFVLVFNAGQHDEGVYTLQGRSSHTSAYVLAFERDDDAERFSQLLHTEGFDLATPLLWDVDQIASFCDAGQFEVSLVPHGTLFSPPAKNSYDTDAFEKLDEEREEEDQQDRSEILPLSQYASEREALERLFHQE